LAAFKLPFPWAVAVALFSAASAGVLIELCVYRPLDKKRASAAVVMVSSLGVYIVAVNAIAILAGNEAKTLRRGADATFVFGDVILTRGQIAQVVVSAIAISLYCFFLSRTSLGRSCKAVADDPTLASVLGVKVKRTRLFAFAGGSTLAAVGAIMTALDVGID